MSTKPAEWQSSNGDEHDYGDRSLEPTRFERAVTDEMAVERVADRFYRVQNGAKDGETYEVDLEAGACTCPDHEYRGSEYVCKHALRAALVEVFAHTVSTELVGRVVRYAREQGCPVDGWGCGGPVSRGRDGFPCAACVDALRTEGVSDWEVWTKLNHTEARR